MYTEEQHTCKWKNSIVGNWEYIETSCDHALLYKETLDNYKYCPYCGKEIERVDNEYTE